MSLTITVSGYNRPAYLERTLRALRACDGLASENVRVLLDPCAESAEQRGMAESLGFEAQIYTSHQGCNLAIVNAFASGFERHDYDPKSFHVHIEDDCVPTRDCLRWFEFARDRYRDDPSIMNVSGYQKASNGRLDQCASRRWFTPWGWGIWFDRFLAIHELVASRYRTGDPTSWDVITNHIARAGRREVFPTVSRIQNIGAERGVHVPSAEWHAANHHVPVTADDLDPDSIGSVWTHVGDYDNADHG